GGSDGAGGSERGADARPAVVFRTIPPRVRAGGGGSAARKRVVDVRALAALLLVLVALPARAARLTFVCRASAPGAPARVVRVPPAGKGHAKVQACVATTPVGHCLFGFCPDLGFVIGCTLDPHCLAAVGPCSV